MGEFPSPPDNLHRAAAGSLLDQNFLLNPLFELCHMGDDAHQAVPPGQARQGGDGLFQRFGIQGAEPFVHKHGVDLYPARVALDHVRKAQGQGKGRLEGLPSGEGTHRPHSAGVVIQHIQFQAGLASQVGSLFLAKQLIPPTGHGIQPQVGPFHHLAEIGCLYILFKGDLLLAGQLPAGGAGQVPDHGVPAIQLPPLAEQNLGLVVGRPVVG